MVDLTMCGDESPGTLLFIIGYDRRGALWQIQDRLTSGAEPRRSCTSFNRDVSSAYA